MHGRPLAVIYALAASGALICTAVMVHAFGALQGTTAEATRTIGITAIIVHLAGVMVFGAGTGAARKAGRRGMAFVGTLVVIGASLFSLYNVAGYVIANSEGVTQAQMAARKAADDAAAREWQAKRERLALQGKLAEQQLKWLQGTTEETAGRQSRRDYVDAGNKLVAEVGKVQETDAPASLQPIVPTIKPNALAELVEQFTGITSQAVTLGVVLFMASLLIVIEAVGWMRAGFHWYESAETSRVPSFPKAGGGSNGDNSKPRENEDGNVISLPVKVAAPAELQPASNANERQKVSAAPRVTVQAPSVPASLKTKPETVAEYLAIHGSATSQRAIAHALGFSEAKVSRDIRKLKGQRKVEAKRIHRANNITRNGGTFHAFG